VGAFWDDDGGQLEDGSEADLACPCPTEVADPLDTEVPALVIELKLAELEQADKEDGEVEPELKGVSSPSMVWETLALSPLFKFALCDAGPGPGTHVMNFLS
jgi:hypothetical protein